MSLQGGYGYNERWDTPAGGAYDAGGGAFQIGVGMNLPVYDGGATSHGVKQAEYAYISSEEDMVMSYRAIKADVKRSYNTVSASVTRLAALEQALVSSQLSFEATRSGYELGSRTVLDVLDANKRLYEAELNLSSARYDYILGYLKLKYDTGALHESDLKGLTEK